MPTITAIKPQKNKKRVNVYLDNKFGFGLDLMVFLKENLKAEQELTEEKIAEIVRKSEFQTTYDKILMFASLRPRSEKEFRIWLTKHKVHESLTEDLFERLSRLEFLDDKKFAIWWVEQRKEFKNKSKKDIQMELRAKGISREIAESVFDEVKIDEKLAIRKLLSKKERLWKNLAGFDRRKKIFSFLIGRGFKYDTVKEVVGSFDED
jgi:regulatory protein